ncbi:MAG: ABC transporter substrate-binding protein [Pseudomonadota bacterium]
MTISNRWRIVVTAAFILCVAVFVGSNLCAQEKAPAKGAPAKKYYPDGTPTRAIQSLDDLLDDFIVKEHDGVLTAADEAHNRELKQKILHGTFDIRELAKLSLAKHWDGLSGGERERFVGLLTDLLEEKALFSKEQSAAKSKNGGKYFIVYRGHKFEDPGKDRSFVKTKVVVPSENVDIELDYRLKKVSSDWRIYDIIVDEASLVDNYKYQFDSIIKKHGYPDLVRRMSEKLTKIRTDRKK